HKAQEYFSWEHFAPATDGATSCFYFPFSFDFRHCPVKFNAGEVLFSLCKQTAYIDQFSLRLSCVDGGDWLAAEFHYDPRLFSAEDVSRLEGQFIKLLDSVAAQPDLEAARLEILPCDQRQQILAGFNRTQVGYPEGAGLQTAFEAQAGSTPD